MGVGTSKVNWTTRFGSTAGGDSGIGSSAKEKLELSVRNKKMMDEIFDFVQKIDKDHPKESAAEFTKPMEWKTTLRPNDLTSSRNSSDYDTTSENGKAVVSSVELRVTDQKPMLQLEESGDNIFTVRVSSFKYLLRCINSAGDRKMRELQNCLEQNRDPMINIVGYPQSTPGSAMLESYERLQLQREKGIENDEELERQENTYRLLLVLNKEDVHLMSSAVDQLSTAARLSMASVTEDLQLFQQFAGDEDENPLKEIVWESDYTFANGCKAPPWRQVYGELCYIKVVPADGEKFIVTVTAKGYFVNKGYITDDKGAKKLNYEQDSEIFPTLIELLKGKSKHFASKISNQEFLLKVGDPNREVDQDRGMSSGEEEEDYKEKVTENDNAASRGVKTVVKKKKVGSTKKISEPSTKWKTLSAIEEPVKPKGAKQTVARKGHGEKKVGSHHPRMRKQVALEDSESDTDDDDLEENHDKKRQEQSNELPAEYWQIQKLVKYLKGGNQTATIIAMCSLRDFDLENEMNQLAIRDVGGLEVLVNLLDTEVTKCKTGALQILKQITKNNQIKKAIADIDGMQPLVHLVSDKNKQLECLAAETIANCTKYTRNRRALRKYGGVKKLVNLLKQRKGEEHDDLARSGALALWSCSKSQKNKDSLRQCGAIPLLANLLQSENEELLIPVVGILQECACDPQYRVLIRSSGMIHFLVKNLGSENRELQTHCASAIFKCAEDEETQLLVREYNGLEPLVKLLYVTDNKELLSAATGAVWKCAVNKENVSKLQELHAIDQLVNLLGDQPEDVLINVVGAIGECAQNPENRRSIRASGGIPAIVNLLTGTNQALLVNVTKAVGQCALGSPENMAIIDKLDGVRLLWSLLKSPNPEVQASAAWAICPCIENAKDAGEMVKIICWWLRAHC